MWDMIECANENAQGHKKKGDIRKTAKSRQKRDRQTGRSILLFMSCKATPREPRFEAIKQSETRDKNG